jgi:hypothetical protein
MRRLLVGLAALAAWACSDSTNPAPKTTSQPHFVVQASAAPPLYAESTSFWAKYDSTREARLYYQGSSPGDSGEELLRFTVPAGALASRPDGTVFGPGDSTRITIKADTSRFIFTFEPTGLQFDPFNPARLRVQFADANQDFDEDGKITSSDSIAKSKLVFWRREPTDTLWAPTTGSLVSEELDEIEGEISSFTEYAVAW